MAHKKIVKNDFLKKSAKVGVLYDKNRIFTG
jgi:hypothetical protein